MKDTEDLILTSDSEKIWLLQGLERERPGLGHRCL